MAKVSAREVIEYFKSEPMDIAELVLELGESAVKARQATSEKISQNLKKARAAKKKAPANQAADSTTEQAQPQTQDQASQEESPIAIRRRAAGAGAGIPSIPAPATIGSTGVESDQEFEVQR